MIVVKPAGPASYALTSRENLDRLVNETARRR